jgi:hypothetical protein
LRRVGAGFRFAIRGRRVFGSVVQIPEARDNLASGKEEHERGELDSAGAHQKVPPRAAPAPPALTIGAARSPTVPVAGFGASRMSAAPPAREMPPAMKPTSEIVAAVLALESGPNRTRRSHRNWRCSCR